MKNYDVQTIDLDVSREKAFAFIADPMKLPAWTQAFASVSANHAIMRTRNGEVKITLAVENALDCGTIDWRMEFSDGCIGTACSRVVEIDRDRCLYSFVLLMPPMPLQQLEGTLQAQSRTLAEELRKLKEILEHGSC